MRTHHGNTERENEARGSRKSEIGDLRAIGNSLLRAVPGYHPAAVKPKDIPAVHRILDRERSRRHAPVARLAEARDEEPFRVLVTTMLSARTRDETTIVVAERLFNVVRKPADFRSLSLKKIEKLIFPIGFYHTKARHLRRLPLVLDKLFRGRIPDTMEGLCELPGVGRKVASLVLTDAFDKPAICVDAHVHRISNRAGLVKTSNPFETEMALRKTLPQRYWKTWNFLLVSFGQTVCTPLRPHCKSCPIRRFCDRRLNRESVVGSEGERNEGRRQPR
ncbi:MAG: endonuclease III [Verrucomicrobiota bacterium]|nr:endonuclease III [Verrucomicrobiota bacterium]